MNKDTIYIDVEDDITAIIGKVKASDGKIIALVPPKRTGVLQSAVNLRLLSRAAKQSKKHLVLISGNPALMTLAASAGIPSARTPQSKPEMPLSPLDDHSAGEDIIDGSTLPVGDHAGTIQETEAADSKARDSSAVDAAISANAVEEASGASHPKTTKSKTVIKVPNFDTLRKKLALGAGVLALLIVFLVWAIFFAPRATIAITARTIGTSANPQVTLATDAATDAEKGTIQAIRHEIKQPVSSTFEASGTKEVGEKSEGQVVFQNCKTDETITIPSGTGISASGKTYITQSAATVPGAKGFAVCTQAGQSSPVSVIAQDIGKEYNTEKGTRFNVNGQPSTSNMFYFRAEATTDIDGGSKKEVDVVTKEDIDKAADQVVSQNIQDIKRQLIDLFGDDAIAVESSFGTDKSSVTSLPAVDQEASGGQAALQGSIRFYMYGVNTAEIGRFLDDYFVEKIEDKENQRIYDNGADKTTFLDVKPSDGGFTATMTATATIGPKINDQSVKEQARGKRYGEVQSSIEDVAGVENVDVTFSPFWVKTVPDDVKRITVEFKLDESK